MFSKKAVVIVVAALVVLAVPLVPVLADHYFCGGVSSSWNNVSNWKTDSGCNNAALAIPSLADKVIIPSGKTCNVDIIDAVADRIVVESTAVLNIQSGKKLKMDGDGGSGVSTISGTVNLEGSASELEFITNDQTLNGSGKIVGKDNAALIDINGATRDLINQTTIEGKLKIIGTTLHNEGTIKANRDGDLWINCAKIQDISTAVWRTDPFLDPGAGPDYPTLLMNTTESTAWPLVGAFIVNQATYVETDTPFCCSGGLTWNGGQFIGSATPSFLNSCP